MTRTAPLAHVIRALAAALLAGVLLEAAGLAIWAERLEIGVMRNIAQPLTQAWHTAVSTVHLDAPRRAALALRERWSGTLMPVAETHPTHDTAAVLAAGASKHIVAPAAKTALSPVTPKSVKSPSASTPTQRSQSGEKDGRSKTTPAQAKTAADRSAEIPAQTPADLRTTQVALVGDSMMAVGLAPVLRRSVNAESGPHFVRAYRSGTGLGRPDVFNWPLQYPQMMGATRPALVICAIGANDAQNFQVDRTVYVFGTPEWKQAYADRVRQFARLLTHDDARVLWIGMPVMREQGFSRRMAAVNALVKETLREFPQITWIDPNPYVAGEDGSFQQYLKDQRGKLVRLRADDGIHLSEDGAAYLVPAISGWMQRSAKGS